MSNNFFGQTDSIHNAVQQGEISGMTTWPLEGTCRLVSIETTYKNGNPYISIKLQHPQKGNREFLVRVPQQNDKDTAKFMGMQRIYSTIFAIAEASPGADTVAKAFAKAQSAAGMNLKYVLSEYESFNERTGKTYTNQSLDSLSPAADGEEGEFQ